ncbi:MAG: HipA domain-containing protein [Gemmatimonadetes bacterium]|nr:HipA domain-containing protein [Gemmatimonadota bacterium]
MTRRSRKNRYTTTSSKIEVDIRAIPLLLPGGWKLCGLEEFPIVGTVPKNYLAYGDPQSPTTTGYIAKRGRLKDYARECVTEEIISKIGVLLPVKMARSKLVRISKDDVRFLSQNFVVRREFELLHGIELAARYFQANPSEVESAFELQNRARETDFYTIKNILEILSSLYEKDYGNLEEGFFRMVAFDAFIGAPDRHGMNWGVLEPVEGNEGPIRFSPIFDTARGLFREYSDSALIKQAQNQGRMGFLENYANKSRPIFSTGRDNKDDHFSLIGWISSELPDRNRKTICRVFDAVNIQKIERMLQMRFRRIITQDRIGFIRDLLALRIDRLREEVRI